MRWLYKLPLRLRSLFRKSRVEQELRDELRFHLEKQTEQNIASGMNAEEARYFSLRTLGGMEQVKEACRDSWGVRVIAELAQDIRYGLRQFRHNPGFTAVAILTLALGIGANTAIFSIVDAVILRPLPYKNADRLTVTWQSDAEHRSTGAVFNTYREFQEWERYSHSFEKLAVATWAQAGAVLSWRDEKREVLAIPASLDFFSLLGVHAAYGRTFERQDLSNPCTVVLSHRFWRERLGGTPDWTGKSLVLNDTPCTVAGIMPEGFSFYPKQTELWTLITRDGDFAKHPWDKNVGVFGLLKPGISRASAQAELTTIQHRIIHEDAGLAALNLEPDVLDLQWEFTWLTGRNLRNSLLVLLGVVLFVLLIACVNVANLLLGRAEERQREMGIRAALGSGRSRLIRQLLTESVLLSLAGSLLGLVVAEFCVRYVNATEATQLPPGNPVSLNWQVLAFATALAIATGILFGLFPAWRVLQLNVDEVLKESSRTASRGVLSHRTSRGLVAVEIALSLVLLVGAALLIQSVARLTNAPMGFERNHLLTAYFQLPTASYPKPADWVRFDDRLRQEIASLPGVVSASFSPEFPSGGSAITIEGRRSAPPITTYRAGRSSVSAGYFQTISVPLLRGRVFDDRDQRESMPVAVLNEAFVKEFFAGRDPIGLHIKFGKADENKPWVTIVGVVGNVQGFTVFKEMGTVADPCAYVPLRQEPVAALAVYVRTAANPEPLKAAIGRAFVAVDSNLPPPEVQTMDEWLSQFTSQPRLRAILLGIFASLGLFLAAVGIYGVLAQRVAQRRHEIGIRMALGAEKHDILKMVVGQGLKLTVIGLAIGILGALGLMRFLSSLLYGVNPNDPLTFIGVSLILTIVALLACYIPARRATKVDPMMALRYE